MPLRKVTSGTTSSLLYLMASSTPYGELTKAIRKASRKEVSLLYKTTVSSYGWRLQSLEIDYWFLVTYKGKGKLNMQVSYVDHTLVCRVMELFY